MLELFTTDKVQEMIKRKISVSDPNKSAREKFTPGFPKYRSKQLQKKKQSAQRKLNNDIVIMNMPPCNKYGPYQTDQINEFINTKQSLDKNMQNKKPFFTNPHISLSIKNYHSTNISDQNPNINKQNVFSKEFEDSGLKRYNSMDIRISTSNDRRRNSFHDRIFQNSNQPHDFQKQDQNILCHKAFLAISVFRPCFRQLLRRDSKIHQKVENKMKKSEVNYQRAISTSMMSRRQSFSKILAAFETATKNKLNQNPQAKTNQMSQNNVKLIKPRSSTMTALKKSRNSPLQKFVQDRNEKKQQQPCRPWSAGKKTLIIPKNTEEENPLQFYSINEKHER